jgi:ribonuclease G
MPTINHIGISRRITQDKERKRLKEIVQQARASLQAAHPGPAPGLIVRTVAEGVQADELRSDVDFLWKLWLDLQKKSERGRAPSLLYSDLDLLLRAVRDMFTEEIDRIIIDSKPDFERVLKFVQAFMPAFVTKVELYDGREPIFDGYGIEIEIDRALQRKVWLKSGGYLVIEQTEALTSVDVNTGRFVGKRNLEDTITKTNLEASREIADQLRLRNIGGMIILDFIDMDRGANREKVFRALSESVRADKARTNVTKISELGLVEMTRKRTRESLGRLLTEPCFYCEGKGYLRSKTTLCYEILREIRREAEAISNDQVVVLAHPEVAEQLVTAEQEYVEFVAQTLGKRIVIRPNPVFHFEQYEIRGGEA